MIEITREEIARTEGKPYIVAYTEPSGMKTTQYFSTESEAQSFIKSRQDKILKEADWSRSWDEFTDFAKKQSTAMSALQERDLIKPKGEGEFELTVPAGDLSDEDVALAKQAGFKIPEMDESFTLRHYKYAKAALEEYTKGGTDIEAVEKLRRTGRTPEGIYASTAILGDALSVLEGIYRGVVGLIPGEQPGEAPQRQFTTDTIKYYEDLTPEEQASLNRAGLTAKLIAELGMSYGVGFAVGLTAKGVGVVAGSVASKLGVTAPAAVSKIASTIAAHPNLATAITLAPVAGLEAHQVYRDFEAGRPADEILLDATRRIAVTYAGYKGFTAGLNFLSGDKMAVLRRATELKAGVDSKGNTFTYAEIDTKKLPRDIADLLRKHNEVVNGKVIITAMSGDSPVSVEVTSNLLADLINGKTLGPDALKVALRKHVSPEQYDMLIRLHGDDIFMMQPAEIAKLMYKEVGYGSPWYDRAAMSGILLEEPIATLPFKEGALKIVGAYNFHAGDVEGLKGVGDMFTYLTSNGATQQQALNIIGQKMSGASMTSIILKDSTLTTAAVRAALTADAMYGASAAVMNSTLTDAGLTTKQAGAVTEVLLESPSVQGYSEALSQLSDRGAKVVVPALDETVLKAVIPQLDKDALTAIVPSLSGDVLIEALPRMERGLQDAVIPEISSTTLTKILPDLDMDTLSIVVIDTDKDVLSDVVTVLRQKGLPDTLTKLTPDALVKIVPELSHKEITDIVPVLSADSVAALITSPALSQATALLVLQSTTFTPAELEGTQITRIARNKILSRIEAMKKIFPTRFLGSYRVTFKYQVGEEMKRVKARSFQDALSLAWRLRRKKEEPAGTEVKKI